MISSGAANVTFLLPVPFAKCVLRYLKWLALIALLYCGYFYGDVDMILALDFWQCVEACGVNSDVSHVYVFDLYYAYLTGYGCSIWNSPFHQEEADMKGSARGLWRCFILLVTNNISHLREQQSSFTPTSTLQKYSILCA